MSGYKLPMEVEATIQHQAGEIMQLKQQLAECERERDEKDRQVTRLYAKFDAVTKERDELKSCIDNDRELFDVPVYVKQLEAKLDVCVTTIKEYARMEECEGFYSSVAHKALAKLGADKTGEV